MRHLRCGFVHRDQLGNSDKFIAFGEKAIKNVRHGGDGGGMDIVGQNDRTWPGSGKNLALNAGGVRVLATTENLR